MPTTTGLTKLLELAALYERKAAALRLSYEEVTGEKVKKAATKDINGQLAKAIALRNADRPEGAPRIGRPPGTKNPAPLVAGPQGDRVPMKERQALIRYMLAKGPKTRGQVHQGLLDQGVNVSEGYVTRLLTEMPDAVHNNERMNMQWTLRARTLSVKSKSKGTSKAHAVKKKVAPAASSKNKRKRRSITELHNDPKWARVIEIVRSADHPLTKNELTPAARALGIRSLTGIANLTRPGGPLLRTVNDAGDKAYGLAPA
jgi:hypothetical protein